MRRLLALVPLFVVLGCSGKGPTDSGMTKEQQVESIQNTPGMPPQLKEKAIGETKG